MAPATTVILEDEEKERKKRGKIADVLDMMPLLGWESEGHAKPDTVLMDVSRDRADYALEQARWRNPITDSLLRARRRATESSPGATTSSTTTAVGAPVVLAKARGMEEAKLRWETPAADCYLAANRKLFENDIIDYPERYEDAHRRKGTSNLQCLANISHLLKGKSLHQSTYTATVVVVRSFRNLTISVCCHSEAHCLPHFTDPRLPRQLNFHSQKGSSLLLLDCRYCSV